MLRLPYAVVLAVQAADRRKGIVQLPVTAIAITPIGGIGKLQQPTAVLVEDRCGERIPQFRPAAGAAVHGVEHRLHALLLAEGTPARYLHGLLIKAVEKLLDHGKHIITLGTDSALRLGTPRRKVTKGALEALHLADPRARVDVDGTIEDHPPDALWVEIRVE